MSTTNEPTLFDLPEWQEVPQARFLSWPRKQQLDYCARRDERAALEPDSPAEERFFLERAAEYRRLKAEA